MTAIDAFQHPKPDTTLDLTEHAQHLIGAQQSNGAIPWWQGHKIDPWDHVEAAMGLTIAGAYGHARKAFKWLQDCQRPDGSWYSAYSLEKPLNRTRETHHAAYIAVGLYHYYLITGDLAFIQRMWPTTARAIEFVLRYQAPSGEIYWALDPRGRVDRMALLTGCSSIFFSLKCALGLAELNQTPCQHWREALIRLRDCINHKPHCFNMTKARFAMDWFYPVLCGAIRGAAAQQRIAGQWKKFVIENMGVRCVSDQPWITIAETCELVLALTAMGRTTHARIVFGWICERTFEDNTFWCGFTIPDMTIWPREKITWTNAVALLAADALYDITPASRLFRHGFLSDA